jgi:hypothetical protein
MRKHMTIGKFSGGKAKLSDGEQRKSKTKPSKTEHTAFSHWLLGSVSKYRCRALALESWSILANEGTRTLLVSGIVRFPASKSEPWSEAF